MPKRSKGVTTIVDIARKLGLSAMTVSRALTGNREVSEKTRQKVLKCAAQMGYQPNRWARSLVTRRSSIIGVVIPDIAHSFFAEITFGIEGVFHAAGYNLLLCHSRGEVDRERSEIRMLVASRVDGLIIGSVQREDTEEPFAEAKDARIPVVLVDRFFEGQEALAVRVDDRAVGKLATEFLIQLGHRRIAHIQGPSISPASRRRKGYMDALRAARIAADRQLITTGDFEIESGREAMKQLLALKNPPTAVFAANDPMGIGAVYACRDAGVKVPDEMSIIGAGNIEGPHHPNPFLTTIDWPRVELGRTAATLLLQAINAPDQPLPEGKVFEPRLLVRQSTASIEVADHAATAQGL